ncbi:hypothetical protein [Geomonas propionica]|uniref:Uncharacterized protein n=1 Tax=Geomonas propionica TaxID=2798582 RepID=A0ABS0YR70_9BACT|nr:hypothetical protein [Geomonas propionica]MBJ6800434.1 hypothetical protein [Geomonas propionica]
MKHLRVDQCQSIAQLITSFRGAIRWNDVIDLGEEVTGYRYSRQSLECKDVIRAAFTQATQREPAKVVGRKSAEVRVLEARIERLQEEIQLLKTVDAQNRERFVLWTENARRHGLDETKLNKPLTRVERRATRE